MKLSWFDSILISGLINRSICQLKINAVTSSEDL